MGRKVLYLRCVSMLAFSGAVSVITATAHAATSDKGGATVIPELVVTAERRVENLQTAAISATVLDQKTLEAKGVVGLTTLQFAAPGIQISDFASANTFNIRGIGQSAVPVDLPSGVVIYRDGVPTLTGYFQNAPYYDMGSVEVLRGPQGTFVGKSASAGAVFIRTADPQLGHFGGSVMAGGGTYGFYETTDVLNVPLSDTLAVRLAIHGEGRESLFDSLTTNPVPGDVNAGGPFTGDDHRRLLSGRLGILWAPNDAFRAVLKVDADYLHFGSHATTGFNPATGLDEDISNPVVNGHHVYIDKGARTSLNMDYTFDGGYKLSSLTGFSAVKTRADWDTNGSNPAPSGFESGGKFTNYSQEFNLLSPDNLPVRWVAGLFWQNYINDIPSWPQAGLDFFTTDAATPTFATPWKRDETSYAGFGQIAFNIAPPLELQIGGRYGHYGFTQFTEWELFPGTPLATPFFDPAGGLTQKYSENSFDWKVNLNWKVNEAQFLYALASRGHTPGSINAGFNGVTTLHTQYKPMEVTNLEAGWKGQFLDGHLRTQLAAYYETFKNYQAAFAFAVPQAGPIDSIEEFKNALTDSHTMGLELSAQGVFGDLSIDGGLALFHSKLGSFGAVHNDFCQLFYTNPASLNPNGGLNCTDPTALNSNSPYYGVYGTSSSVVLSGAKTPFSPEVTGNIGVAYTFHLEGSTETTITPRFDVAYRSKSYSYLFQNPSTELPSVTLLNASVRVVHGPWWGEIWGSNLTDERYPGAKQNVAAAAGDAFFPEPHVVGIVYMAPPRLVGVRIGREF